MGKIIYLIGENENQSLLQSIADKLDKELYQPIVCSTSLLESRWSFVVNAELAILGISPTSNRLIYKLAEERYRAKKYTLNYFIFPTSLSEYERNCIGRNQTIFKNVGSDNYDEIQELLLNSDNFQFIDDPEVLNWNNSEDEGNSPKSKAKRWIGICVAAGLIGFGIWGYSAYVESAKKEAELALWNAWEKYLSDTSGGQILAVLGEKIENTDKETFYASKFKEYIEGQIDPSTEISWYELSPYVKNMKINISSQGDLEPLMNEHLRSLYIKANDSDYYLEGGWNPVSEMKGSDSLTLTDISVSEDGKSGIVNYTLNYGSNENNPQIIYLEKNNRGIWEIVDFENDGYLYTEGVEYYFEDQLRHREIFYEGSVYTQSGTFPITLKINFGEYPITAVYCNKNINLTLPMSGEQEDDSISLSADNNGEIVSFLLENNDNKVLTGKFCVEDEDGPTCYDVMLKEAHDDNN